MKRIYHTWDKWECYKAGFYAEHPPKGMSAEECETTYKTLLIDLPSFAEALQYIIDTWSNSCEHYLTNENMNRIAWLGQAALAYKYGIPSRFRGGFNLLNEEQQQAANEKALEYLNKWRAKYDEPPLTMDQVKSRTEADLY